MTGRSRSALSLLFLAVIALAASIWIWTTGGFLVHFGSVRVSVKELRNPLVVAILASVGAWVTATGAERLGAWRLLVGTFDRFTSLVSWLTPALAVAAALATTVIGITKGALVAAGTDVYGYVSQAHLWAHGTLRVYDPHVSEFGWRYAVNALSPAGYRPGPDNLSIVPVYSPGLPIVMALFERIGGPHAVFYVVPLLGGAAVLATYALGVQLGRRSVGLAAALMLATSPAFVFQLMLAMSDVPVTAWWLIALVLVPSNRRSLTFLAGLSTSLAILTRPNLAPAAAVPALWLTWQALKTRSWRDPASARVVCFALGVVPGCLAVALINRHFYGSPLLSGYGPLSDHFAWSHILPNVVSYVAWMWQSQAAIFLAVVPLVGLIWWRANDAADSRRRSLIMMWGGFVAAVFAAYLPYYIFDNWFWLRFVLPAWPPLLVLAALTIVAFASRLRPGLAELVAGSVVAVVLGLNVLFLSGTDTFNLKRGEEKSVVVGRYIADHLPPNAVFLSMQQSGSVRYYSNRLTLRYDQIPGDELNRVVSDLIRLGYHPYAILEDQEEAQFVQSFQGNSRLALLDWPPIVTTRHEIRVRIYDLVEPDRQMGRDPVGIF